MRAQSMSVMPSEVPIFDEGTRLPSTWFPEARFVILCARTTVSEAVGRRIREAAQQPMDWPFVLDLARYHGIGPLVSRTIGTVCDDLVPQASLGALRRSTLVGTLLNRVLAQELVRLCRAFNESGVPVVSFKGVTLGIMAYEDRNLRDFDDLDFIVPQSRLSDARDVLLSQGYRPLNPSQDECHVSDFDQPYHLFLGEKSRILVDLQWVMAHQHFSFRLDRADVWDRRIRVPIDGQQVETIAPEELLNILCVHGSKHAWERLKWIVDVAELVRAKRLDWARVFATAEKWSCRRMLLLGLSLAHRVMSIPLPPDIVSAVSSEYEIPELAERMPKSLLAQTQRGIDEHDGAALYFTLKDDWWDRWWYGLALCHADHPVVARPPSWFRWKPHLRRLNRAIRFLRAVICTCMPLPAVRRAIGRWIQAD